jgi:hypothetical protein
VSYTIIEGKPYQPYFEAYIKVHDVKHGDKVMTVDFLAWIQGQHLAFRKLKGWSCYRGYPPETQREFEEFIVGEASNG